MKKNLSTNFLFFKLPAVFKFSPPQFFRKQTTEIKTITLQNKIKNQNKTFKSNKTFCFSFFNCSRLFLNDTIKKWGERKLS